MDAKNNSTAENLLQAWRTRILNVFLTIVAVVAAVMTGVSVMDAISRPGQWPAVFLFLILELILAALAFFRGIDNRIRAWGVLLVPYAVGVTALASYGLGSSGRIYLLAVPIGALILIGVRSAVIMSALSVLTMALFAFLANQGLLVQWLVFDRNSLLLADWMAELSDTLMLLITIMVLLIMFYRFQESLIARERRTQAELKLAHQLLEDQNATLEQKVEERTEELSATNRNLEQRNAELTILNSLGEAMTKSLDVKTMTRIVGDQLCDIFNADAVSILLLDSQNNLIHSYYEFDKNEGGFIEHIEPFPLGTGLTSRVITSRQPLLLGTLDEEIANGAYFPPELLQQSEGSLTQSWLGVPIIVNERVLGVIFLGDYQPHAFGQNHLRLMQTLCSNIGVAIENMHLLEAAQESQRRMADIIEFLPDATLVVDREGRVIAWNRAIEEMTGVEAVDMLGKGNFEYALPFYGERKPILIDLVVKSQQELEQNYIQIQRQGSILVGETYVPRLRGNVHYLQATASILRDSRGSHVGAIEIIRDITDHKRVETELRESGEKLRLIFENAFDGISIYEEKPDEEKRILLDCNERYCQMAGRSKEELLVTHDTRVIQIDLGVASEGFGWEPISAGRAFSGVFSWIRPDGRENIIEYNAAPTRVKNRYFTIGIDRDVTERRRVQEELRQAKEMAEAATQAKSAFLANMSHELRTPLNAIIGFTRIVRRKAEGVLPEKQTENLEKVLISAEHLLNLINTVLDIAKIEAGRMDVLVADFRVAALIDLCANTALPLLNPAVVLEKQVDERLSTIYSDQDKIRQIILNLLSNAAKFTHQGKITLAARPDGDNLCISVTDTGIGIGKEALPRIFKEFQQADTSTTRQYGGTGLGLSISRNLARLLRGDLTVESEPGQGSTFTLTIPFKYTSKLLSSEAATPSPSHPEPVSLHEMTQCFEQAAAKKRILIIDDDPDAVYLMQENLNQQEFEIIGTRNGYDGLRMAREQQPQAILLDIVLPGADGWQILHDLKEGPVTADIPVILLTIVDKKALGFRLGAAAYLLKPLDPVAVRDVLNRVIVRGDRRQKHVLIVDDDPNIADMLRQFLPEADFKVDSALDGVAGLQAVAINPPDIILLDIIMPRLDGFAVIESLRAEPETRDLPIIVISAKELTAAESARLKETVAFVMKKQGFQGGKLADEINNVLKK